MGAGGYHLSGPFSFAMLLRFLLLLGAALLAGCGPVAEARLAEPLPLPAERGPGSVPRFDGADLEWREVSRIRREHGRAAPRPDTSLAALARTHSRAMLERGFFTHRDPDGLRAGERAHRAGYAFHHLGENLFQGRLYDTVSTYRRGGRTLTSYLWYRPDELAALAVAMWMESPGHRENMLSAAFDYGGVGFVTGPAFEVFITLHLSAL